MTVVASDDFNRANGAVGANWTTISPYSGLSIVSNQCPVVSGLTDYAGVYTAAASTSDDMSTVIDAVVISTDLTNDILVYTRMPNDGTETGYVFDSPIYNAHTDDWQLQKATSGSFTMLANGTGGTPATGTKSLEVRAVGTTITCYIAGVLKATVTDSTHSGSTKRYGGCHVYSDTTGSNAVDNFVVNDLGGGGGGPTAPGAPTALAAGMGTIGQAALTWTVPASDGGSAITDYLVEYNNTDDGLGWLTFSHTASTSTSITVTGLFAGQAYTFRVSAVNAIGTGSASSTASGTTLRSSALISDDFPGSAVDTSKWRNMTRLGDQSNSEVDGVDPSAFTVSGGILSMTTSYVSGGFSSTDTTTSGRPLTVFYKSGQLQQDLAPFLYGDIQIRAKIAAAAGGLWPCLWMLGTNWQASQPYTANVAGANWPNGGWWEIDIAEFLNGHRTQVNNTLHFVSANRFGSGEKTLPFDASTRFMVYRLIWTPTSLTYQVDAEDGVGWRTTLSITGGVPGSDIPNTPGYIVINQAVGGSGGTPVSTDYPATTQIDYVRVVQGTQGGRLLLENNGFLRLENGARLLLE